MIVEHREKTRMRLCLDGQVQLPEDLVIPFVNSFVKSFIDILD